MDGRVEVYDKRQDIKGEDQGNDPLKDGGGVSLLETAKDTETDEEGELDEDKDKLDPERSSEHAVLSVHYSQSLILPTDEKGRKQISANKEAEEGVVLGRIFASPEDGQADQADGANHGEYYAKDGHDLLRERSVGNKTAPVSKPALSEKGQVEEDSGANAAGDEKWLEVGCADVTDVGDFGRGIHGWQVTRVFAHDPAKEKTEKHC